MCRDSGRLEEALAFAEQQASYSQQGGMGAWTQLSDETQRLQVLNEMGHSRQVLIRVQELWDRIGSLPTPGPHESTEPWHAREVLLGTGRDAAVHLGRWDEVLNLNAALATSMRGRHAPAIAIAGIRFSDYCPLLSLGRTGEALDLLLYCRQAFQDARDVRMLGRTLSALADVEKTRGHDDAAIRFERDALRYKYLAGDVTGIAVSYHNLGHYLRRNADQADAALAAHLNAALVLGLTGIGGTGFQSAAGAICAAANDLRLFGNAAELPARVTDLCRKLGDIPGTDPAGLIVRLSPDPKTAERTLREFIAHTQALASRDVGLSAEDDA